ncbi:helix-turn-helix domain-containing protein [Virgibacillus sp. MSJ-26]|uniref:helix-turn-helix domain-containing protein n=1 Tax=Virgibacillus sp. MSJ-26 TaxID=2841522 RepID=UPI001C105643|nr:helix-turn-helix domain-containing protein [Virgibacillus sp. MSJ-26]MBU5465832.1 helix-turn-helix domain-containing protein [Virgibacillus sp. MSJ-26]
MQKRTMSVQDVALYFGLHKDTVYDLVKENKLPHFKVGGRILFLEDVLEKWMMDNMTNE